MLLTISTTHSPASDLGFLLHKHPDRIQSFDLSFGMAHVFYPTSSPELATCALLIDLDPVAMVRGKSQETGFLFDHYVNDRPFVASSFMSVAISRVFGTALSGRCNHRPELVETAIPLNVSINVLPVRGGMNFLHRVFEPLGYEVEATGFPLDQQFPEWGESPYFSVRISATKTLAEMLTQLYVLLPVFDNDKHYFIGQDELTKLMEKGAGWLASHPEKEQITRRYLRFKTTLFREALARLSEDEASPLQDDSSPLTKPEESLEKPLSLNEQRLTSVVEAIRESGAKRVLDLGCGEGNLIKRLLQERQFEQIVGLDVSMRSLEVATRRLKLSSSNARAARRVQLLHGSLTYRDQRLEGFDAAALVEVIEHLDRPRLTALERVVFEFARPNTVVITTPNQEYNAKWETLPAGQYRHSDHRFEWTRSEFQTWATQVAMTHAYETRFMPIGPVDETLGPPTQMAIFTQRT